MVNDNDARYSRFLQLNLFLETFLVVDLSLNAGQFASFLGIFVVRTRFLLAPI